MTAEYRGNGRSVVIDDETALWCGRMLQGEGWKGDKGAAVLYSTLFRYLGYPKKWPDYKTMLQLFSQAINQRWLPGGDLYEKYKNVDKPAYRSATSEAAVNRRLKNRSMTWDQMSDGVKQRVIDFRNGQLPIPWQFGDRKISNFGSWEGIEKAWPDGFDIGGDWFFVDPNLLQDWELQIADSTENEDAKKEPKAGFALGILLLMAAYWLMKKGK